MRPSEEHHPSPTVAEDPPERGRRDERERRDERAPVHRKPPPPSPEADRGDLEKGLEKLDRVLPY
jgi:hypothetical protein